MPWNFSENSAHHNGRNEYDDAGRVICSTHYTLDGEVSTYDISEYDERGNKTKESCYGADDTLISYEVYFYDVNGKEIREEVYAADGVLECYYTRTYHDNGCPDVYSIYNPEGALDRCWVYLYDKNWNCIGEKTYDIEGNLTGSRTSEWYQQTIVIISIFPPNCQKTKYTNL